MLESGDVEINADIPYEQKSHRTEIILTLAPNESVFIVYPAEEDDKETSGKRAQGKGGFGKRSFGDRLGSNRIYRDFYSKR